MVIRGGGAFLNILINAVLILGLELGVLGAASGTVTSTVGICLTLSFCLLRGRLPFLEDVPVRISVTGPYFDRALARRILQVSAPLIGHRVVSRAAHFPMLMIAGLRDPGDGVLGATIG